MKTRSQAQRIGFLAVLAVPAACAAAYFHKLLFQPSTATTGSRFTRKGTGKVLAGRVSGQRPHAHDIGEHGQEDAASSAEKEQQHRDHIDTVLEASDLLEVYNEDEVEALQNVGGTHRQVLELLQELGQRLTLAREEASDGPIDEDLYDEDPFLEEDASGPSLEYHGEHGSAYEEGYYLDDEEDMSMGLMNASDALERLIGDVQPDLSFFDNFEPDLDFDYDDGNWAGQMGESFDGELSLDYDPFSDDGSGPFHGFSIQELQ